jgi:phosphoglucomutase/phosphomannomutase
MSTAFDAALEQLDAALGDGKLTPAAAENIRAWLTEPRYTEYAAEVADHIARSLWKQLDDVFWTVIPFGTGGRRGRMYRIGTNAINDRTIGESAQGLADYVRQQHDGGAPLSCAIAYDTRHRSRDFAELSAEVMVAAGFKVFFLDGYRSTPELSFAVRYQHCACGIMVTASHNPPSDNAVKAYWSTGGQILPPHDRGVIDRVMSVETVSRVPFVEALADGRVTYCQDEVDRVYHERIAALSTPGPRDIKIIYSPMHGVGASAIVPVLDAVGFADVEVFAPHAEPDGDFPNVPDHVSNPENPATFDAIITRARDVGADVILSTDPDADRLGLAAPRTLSGDDWVTFTGNQIGALLVDYVLSRRQAAGQLSSDDYVVKTLVTTEMIRHIADSYGVRTEGDLLVGFKWIAGVIDQVGPEHFVFGTEESHGYLAGTNTRDKDAVIAALLAAELTAECKAAGESLHEKLDNLFWQHGCHAERTVSQTMPGSEGMAQMKKLMQTIRTAPPKTLGGLDVAQVRDYGNGTLRTADGEQPLEGPRGDLVILDLASDGNYVAVRPSGTEPKVKFYMFTYEPAEQLANLEDTKAELNSRLDAFASELAAFAENV